MNMAAQVPALFELLSGMPVGDLINRIPALSDKQNSANGTKPPSANNTVESLTDNK